MVDCFFVGSSRSGSTWLYEQLKTHPEIYMPVEKPVRFWNRKVYGGTDLKSKFPKLTLHEYENLMKSGSGKKVLDMTDGYNVLGTVAIQHIKLFYPNSKIVFVLRNPIDIHISHSLLESSNIDTALSVQNIKKRIEDPYSYFRLNAAQAANIQRWTYWFGPKNVGCFFYDHMKKNQYEHLRNISNFIGINSSFWTNTKELKKKINIRKTMKEPPIEIYDLLYDYFKPEIEKLETVLEVDLTEWKNYKLFTGTDGLYHPRGVIK